MTSKLKLLYIYFGGDLSAKLPGVHTKILSKINYLNTEQSSCHGISLSLDSDNINNFENLIFINAEPVSSQKYFTSIKENKMRYLELHKYLRNNDEFDYIIFRYPLASKYLLNFCKIYKGKVLIEFNTLEVSELFLSFRNLIKGTKFSIKPGYFINMFENGLLPIIREIFYKGRILKETKLAIAVSNEILVSLKKSWHSTNGIVLSNTIDTNNYSMRNQISEASNSLKLFMLIGFGADWHGIDRLMKSAVRYKGDRKIEIYIYGETNKVSKANLENLENIEFKFFPALSKKELDVQLLDKHIGIGTLSAHLKNLYEASPLKVREYLARGFPVIIGYDDTDLSHTNQLQKMIFRVNNDTSLIDFDKIINWYDECCKIEGWSLEIQEYAKLNLDTSTKMKYLLSKLHI